MLSLFVGFTAGCQLFKENGIFLRDKGQMELTYEHPALFLCLFVSLRWKNIGTDESRALQDGNF